MMREEIEQRTGFFPTQLLYAVIEKHYSDFEGDKDAFCEAYRSNAGALAEKIRYEASMQEITTRETGENLKQYYETRIAKLEKDLEREREWRAYEPPENVSSGRNMQTGTAGSR